MSVLKDKKSGSKDENRFRERMKQPKFYLSPVSSQ